MNMAKLFDTVAIIGVGLLGASLGLALKQKALAGTVRGVGRRRRSLDKALEIGAIDEACLDVAEAATGADLIVICTPAATVPQILDAVRPVCGKSAVVTDVASTKALLCAHAKQAWAEPYRFVGSHPMAGSEKFGPEHAEAELYSGSVCFVEQLNGHAEEAHTAVMDLWDKVGARVVQVEPEMHDAMVAKTSHVPHIVAAALSQLIDNGDADEAPFIGSGFIDTTRVAEGLPELWRDICLTNPEAIEANLSEVIRLLRGAADAVTRLDGPQLEEFFRKGRDARIRALGQ